MKDVNELTKRMEQQNVWDWVLWREATAAIREQCKLVAELQKHCEGWSKDNETLRAELFLAKSEAMALEKDLEMVQTENDELTRQYIRLHKAVTFWQQQYFDIERNEEHKKFVVLSYASKVGNP